jgi:hypothetical protein
MQIRAQLRRIAVTMAQHPEEYEECCYAQICPSGYHGIHKRVRFKSRARNHGNKTGQS